MPRSNTDLKLIAVDDRLIGSDGKPMEQVHYLGISVRKIGNLVRETLAAGVAVIYQELHLVPGGYMRVGLQVGESAPTGRWRGGRRGVAAHKHIVHNYNHSVYSEGWGRCVV